MFDREVKFKIVNETDAYGVGCKLHPNLTKIYDWVRIPIPDVYARIGYIHNINRPLSTEAEIYIKILEEELKGLII